jgi:hypothetical protein
LPVDSAKRDKAERKERETMSLIFDPIAARQRHEEMLREAFEARRARLAAKANGAESLLSRMVKLLSRSSHPAQSSECSEETLNQHTLAPAKSS